MPINGSILNKKPAWFRSIKWDAKLSIYLVFTLFVFILVGAQFLPQNAGLHIGKPSPVTVISPKNFEIETKEDRAISDRILQSRIMEVKPAYQHNFMVENQTEKQITNIFIGLKQQHFKVKGINDVYETGISPALISRLSELNKEDLISVEVLLQELVKNIYLRKRCFSVITGYFWVD